MEKCSDILGLAGISLTFLFCKQNSFGSEFGENKLMKNEVVESESLDFWKINRLVSFSHTNLTSLKTRLEFIFILFRTTS